MNSQHHHQNYSRQVPLVKTVLLNNQAHMLKIPSVPHKPIIKLTQSQLKELIAVKKQPQQTFQSSTVPNTTNLPLSIERACGLFNDVEFDTIEHGDQLEKNMEFNDLINSSNELTLQNNIMLDNNANSPKAESKFAKKLNGLNMKLNITSQQTPVFRNTEESILDLKLTEDEWSKLITPATEKLCFQFINQNNPTHSVPAIELNMNDCFDFDMLLTPLPFNVQKEDPFVNANSPNINLSTVNGITQTSSLDLDHVYSSNDKRKLSCLDETTQDTIVSSSSNSIGCKPHKKQRTRGIYRLDDVTNEEEMENYLERRKKNNISSKVSRANKKWHYKEMDDRSDMLELENERLRKRIVKLEEINKLIKDELMDKIVNK